MSELLALRKRYTAQEIATMYGVSRRTIYNWLNGVTPLPRHRRALEGGFQGTGKDRIYVLPPLRPYVCERCENEDLYPPPDLHCRHCDGVLHLAPETACLLPDDDTAVERLAEAMSKHYGAIGFEHATSSCGPGCAKAVMDNLREGGQR